MVIWPILRSSSASRLSASILFPSPENAFVGFALNSRRQRCKIFALTSNRRATRPAGLPDWTSFTAASLNSRVNFLRELISDFPMSPPPQFKPGLNFLSHFWGSLQFNLRLPGLERPGYFHAVPTGPTREELFS